MAIFIYLTALLLVIMVAVVVRYQFTSFHAQSSQDYTGLGPEFDLTRHLSGSLICEGLLFGPTGRMTSRFHARLTGTWIGTEGVLEEDFTYDSGAQQKRTWHLSLTDAGRFSAGADDIRGIGRGTVAGPTVRLCYCLVLPKDAGGHRLDVTDWMYLTEHGTIINRSQFRKFGLKVAELVATIRRDEAG